QGEALLNDGVGIVVFFALVAFASGVSPDLGHAALSVFTQSLGGLALGAAAGLLAVWAMRAVDDFTVAVGLSLALAMGVYAFAQAVGVSGPIAAVGAGFAVGSGLKGERPTEVFLRRFWSLIDEILEALLFLLLGLQVIAVRFEEAWMPLCLAAVALVLAARFIVVLPWGAWFRLRGEEAGAGLILAWGGLHGALCLALALTLPPVPERPLLLQAAFLVAALSVALQGLTFVPLVDWVHRRGARRA
ncbi:MAG: cation:proton antiporter, partial [Caulobacteraceae bacterium]